MPNVPVPNLPDISKLVNAAKGNPDAPATNTPSAAPPQGTAAEASPAVKPVSPAVVPSAATSASLAAAKEAERARLERERRDAAVVPAASVPPPADPKEYGTGPGGMPLFTVKLQDCPEFVIEAEDRLDAIERYKAHCGIIATIHPFSVQRV